MVKLFIFTILSFSSQLVANDNIAFSLPLNADSSYLKVSKVKDASTIFSEHVLKSYNTENVFFCGTAYLPTPDEELKSEYESGLIRIVNEYSPSGEVKAFTPIRQLAANPIREAVYEGYYFVSIKR